MSRSDEAAGGGCFALILICVVISLIITYWVQILLATLVIGSVTLLVMWAVRAHQASVLLAEQRRRCQVCQSPWTDSVILADFDDPSTFCPDHAARWGRISGLEGKIFRGD